MVDERELPTRKAVEQALRQIGLSHRQARKFVAVGWPALVGDVQAERDELRAQLDDLAAKLAQPRG